MQKTELKNSKQVASAQSGTTQSTGLSGSSPKSSPASEDQKSLSRSMAEHLLDLMKTMKDEAVREKSVKHAMAACQVAGELYKVMKINLELKRMDR